MKSGGGVAAIVAAGGTGSRLGRKTHKPFVRLAGRPLLCWTLRALEASRLVERIVLVVHPDDIRPAGRMVRRFRLRKVGRIVAGGSSRSDSVWRGIQALPAGTEWVLVHDGARPLVSPALVEETLKAAREHGAAIAAVPVVPTIKQAEGGWVTRTLDRTHLWAVQTPQAFRLGLLRKAHERGRARKIRPTDDAALVEAMGRPVRIVLGSERNLKVTTPEELLIAGALLRRNR